MFNSNGSPRNVDEAAGRLSDILRQGRLILRLLGDARIPMWQKAIPVIGILYVLSPVDLIPDFIVGLGQLDDIAILLLAAKLFLDMTPRNIVAEHEVAMASRDAATGNSDPGSYVDANFTVLDEGQKK